MKKEMARIMMLLTVLVGVVISGNTMAADLSGDVDLILPPTLASNDAPFYRGASVKVGDTVLPVKEATLASGQLAEYQPEHNRVVVSNAAGASEGDKGQALLDVVTAMQASAIATAAGQ